MWWQGRGLCCRRGLVFNQLAVLAGVATDLAFAFVL
jgi:hypothetical protein